MVVAVALGWSGAGFAEAGGPGGGTNATSVSEEQAGSRANTISGSLVDPSGAAIANAQVSLVAPDNKPIGAVATDNSGSFHFDGIPPGNYSLDCNTEGFRKTRINLNVGTKRQAALRIVMPIAVLNESITVASGESVPLVSIETSENQNANTIDRNALDRVPVFDQDYIATMSRFLYDNATGTNGVSLDVNGIEANGSGGTPSAGQQVKIKHNPYS